MVKVNENRFVCGRCSIDVRNCDPLNLPAKEWTEKKENARSTAAIEIDWMLGFHGSEGK
jgi:hypothetical protein